jgi:hypothetical protein
MPATRDMILDVLRRKTGKATTPRNMAMWFGRPVDEVKAELSRLQAEGLAGPLPRCQGGARIWVIADDLP